jgi:polysaccharide biosynthesis transport protein
MSTKNRAVTPPTSNETAAASYPPAGVTRPTLANLWIKQRRALRRRLLPILLTALATLTLAALAAFFWPPTYRSTGIILIEQQEVPEDFVRSAVSSYADQRVQVISQRVMTSANLLEIISKYNLYADERRTKTREAIIANMREDIGLNMISADVIDPRQGRATKATIAFSVSYENRSAQVAVAVANEITSLYLRENLETRKQQAAGTADFLGTEAARIGTQVTDLEQKIAAFKAQNENSLPEFAQLNVQLASRAQDDVRELDARVRALDQQIVYLESQLAQINPTAMLYSDNTGQRVLGSADQLKLLKTRYAAAVASYSARHPDVLRLKREIEGLEKELGSQSNYRDTERELEQERADLAIARQTHTEDYPDVVRLSRQVAQLEEQLKNAPRNPATPVRGEQPDNPAYIQIQANRQAAQTERASLLAQRVQLRARLAELEQRSAATPITERDYNALKSELESAQKKHAEVQQKQMEAQLTSNLETERKGERFTLIEPPMEPQKPVRPNRALILMMGAVLALGAAIGLMRLLEALDTRIRSREDIITLLSVPPLAVIPWLKPAKS